MMKVNKKVLQLIAAILILVFHLWINVTNLEIENYIRLISYVGVDIFFFVSAYAISQRYDDSFDYSSFIKNRFKNIYLKYLMFLLIALIYKRYHFFIYKLLGIEIFIKGGGAFLWFLPAIMMVYIIFPLFLKWQNRYKTLIVLIVYFLVAFLITNYTNYDAIFILLNRIPAILLAYELSQKDIKNNKLLGFIVLITGLLLLYFFGYKKRLDYPIHELYYLCALPLIYGLTSLTEDIKLSRYLLPVANATLEIYAVQMIFGFDISKKICQLLQIPLLSNIVTLSLSIIISIIIKSAFDKMFSLKKNF